MDVLHSYIDSKMHEHINEARDNAPPEIYYPKYFDASLVHDRRITTTSRAG